MNSARLDTEFVANGSRLLLGVTFVHVVAYAAPYFDHFCVNFDFVFHHTGDVSNRPQLNTVFAAALETSFGGLPPTYV